jgi:hypothetical protein
MLPIDKWVVLVTTFAALCPTLNVVGHLAEPLGGILRDGQRLAPSAGVWSGARRAAGVVVIDPGRALVERAATFDCALRIFLRDECAADRKISRSKLKSNGNFR